MKRINLALVVDGHLEASGAKRTKPAESFASSQSNNTKVVETNLLQQETVYSSIFKYSLPFFSMPGLRYLTDIPRLLDTREQVCSWCEIPKILKALQPNMLLACNGNDNLFPGITFLEEPHEYWLSEAVCNRLSNKSATENNKWNHHRFYGSVTKMAGRCFSPFDEEKSIGSIQGSRNYNNQTYEYYQMTAAQISNQYLAANMLGTMLHYLIELFFNGYASVIPPQLKDKTWRQFEQFYVEKIEGKYVPFLTEFRVYSFKYDVAGSIDFICVRLDEWEASKRERRLPKLTIMDWKRTKEFKRTSFTGEMAAPPLQCFPDVTLYKYFIQLGIYKRIIENNSPYIVESLFLCRFHPSNETCEMVNVPLYEDLIDKLFALRLAELQQQTTT